MTVLQYANRHDEAVAVFTQALAEVPPDVARPHRYFILQHLGKCLVEMEHYDQAHVCFTAALALRQVKGDAVLSASTERALAGLAQLRGEAPAS